MTIDFDSALKRILISASNQLKAMGEILSATSKLDTLIN